MTDWGFTTLERDIFTKQVFEDRKLLQLYIYLRSQAKYKPTNKLINNQWRELQPGELTLGNRQLAAVIDVSGTTAFRMLRKLQELGEITIEPLKTCTLIRLNYWPQKVKHPPGLETQWLQRKFRVKVKHRKNTDETQMKPPITGYKENKKDIYIAVVAHLNKKAGTNYKPTSGATQRLINGRIAEGFTLDDFRRVIDVKAAQWKDDPKMRPYLRPQTLFSTKFEGYLNEQQAEPKQVRTVYE